MDNQPASSANAIELRIEELSQLFHSLDPFPFRERDLDKDAEEFIVGWARELPADQQLRIVIHKRLRQRLMRSQWPSIGILVIARALWRLISTNSSASDGAPSLSA
jgi:hypothetical protein